MSESSKKRTRRSAPPNRAPKEAPNQNHAQSDDGPFEGQIETVEKGVSEQQIETIRTSITKVAKAMGQGRRESVYQHALKVELSSALQTACLLEYPLPIMYEHERVGVNYIDLLVPNKFFIEVKSTLKLNRKDVLQTMAYARDLNLYGILVNFSQGTAPSITSRSPFEFLVVNGHSVVHTSV